MQCTIISASLTASSKLFEAFIFSGMGISENRLGFICFSFIESQTSFERAHIVTSLSTEWLAIIEIACPYDPAPIIVTLLILLIFSI